MPGGGQSCGQLCVFSPAAALQTPLPQTSPGPVVVVVVVVVVVPLPVLVVVPMTVPALPPLPLLPALPPPLPLPAVPAPPELICEPTPTFPSVKALEVPTVQPTAASHEAPHAAASAVTRSDGARSEVTKLMAG